MMDNCCNRDMLTTMGLSACGHWESGAFKQGFRLLITPVKFKADRGWIGIPATQTWASITTAAAETERERAKHVCDHSTVAQLKTRCPESTFCSHVQEHSLTTVFLYFSTYFCPSYKIYQRLWKGRPRLVVPFLSQIWAVNFSRKVSFEIMVSSSDSLTVFWVCHLKMKIFVLFLTL